MICCEVFLREACLAIARTPHVIDPEFTPLGAHENPERLRELVQSKIDALDRSGKYEAVLLGFGLCGNSAVGLRANSIPLVIPRAHDCCTIFLGSREKFMEYFKDRLSSKWSSRGYMERDNSYLRETDTAKMLGIDRTYQEFVEKYGEENAKYLWETLHPEDLNNELIYIEIPETSHPEYQERLRAIADEEGKNLRILEGDMRLIRGLVEGDWNEEEYLIVPPGRTIQALYDYDRILTVC